MEEELFVSDETDQIAKILDAKYKPADLKEITENLSQLTIICMVMKSLTKLFNRTSYGILNIIVVICHTNNQISLPNNVFQTGGLSDHIM